MSDDPLGLNGARIKVAMSYAQNASSAAHLDQCFGGKGKHITREDVAKDFSEEAAFFWQEIINAQKAFMEAADAALAQTKGETDD